MKNRLCTYCGKTFQSKRKRECCDRSCAAKLAMQTKGRMAWQPEEEELLEDFCRVKPVKDVIRAVQRLERKNGWPIRTSTSIKVKIKRMGLSRVCIYDNLTPSELARICDVPRDRVEGWVERRECPCRWVDGNKRAISLSAFQKWVRENRELLAGISRDALAFILTDKNLIEDIASLPPPVVGRPRPVRRIDTGQTFESVKAAARASFVHPKSISGAIRRGGRSGGTMWEYIPGNHSYN